MFKAELVDFAIYEIGDTPFDQPIVECPECGKLGEQGDGTVIHKALTTLKRGGGDVDREVLDECEIEPVMGDDFDALNWLRFAVPLSEDDYIQRRLDDDKRT